MECMARLREGSPDMEVLSLYQLLLDMNVSGGCNSASYTLFEDVYKRQGCRKARAADYKSRSIPVRDSSGSFISVTLLHLTAR